MIWPELPKSGFVSGRVATKEDVDAGQAIFSMDGKSKGPIEIEIPQYAIWTDQSGAEHPVIVTQAETAPNGMQIVGMKTLDGSDMAATLAEVRLLGSKKPS
jgi:hypothetical protein